MKEAINFLIYIVYFRGSLENGLTSFFEAELSSRGSACFKYFNLEYFMCNL